MAGIVTFQGKIAVTNTPQQLPSNPGQYRSASFSAKLANTAVLSVSSTNGSGATDGTGTGYILEKGLSVALVGLNDTNAIWVTGTANDVYSFAGTT